VNASSAILSSPVAVRGLGVLFTRGRGVDALARAVDEGWRPPVPLAAPFAPGGPCPAYPVDLQTHGEREVMRRLRRADRFTLLAAGFTNIPFNVFSLAAGFRNTLDPQTFFLGALAGRVVRFYLLGLLLFLFGPSVRRFVDRYLPAVSLLLLALFAVCLVWLRG
jgi:hypothetical protein